jgi:hypothetical protein
MRITLCLVVVALATLAFAQDVDSTGAPGAFRAKAGWADLGDFGSSFTVAAEYALPEWIFTAGWADISDAALMRGTDSFVFDGNYWYGEADYVYRSPHNPRIYVGGGLGWYDVQGRFNRVAEYTTSSSDNCLGANVVLGFESDRQNLFGEVRWVFLTDHFDNLNSDGLRAFVGLRF